MGFVVEQCMLEFKEQPFPDLSQLAIGWEVGDDLTLPRDVSLALVHVPAGHFQTGFAAVAHEVSFLYRLQKLCLNFTNLELI
jgi:hypothetical protein